MIWGNDDFTGGAGHKRQDRGQLTAGPVLIQRSLCQHISDIILDISTSIEDSVNLSIFTNSLIHLRSYLAAFYYLREAQINLQ